MLPCFLCTSCSRILGLVCLLEPLPGSAAMRRGAREAADGATLPRPALPGPPTGQLPHLFLGVSAAPPSPPNDMPLFQCILFCPNQVSARFSPLQTPAGSPPPSHTRTKTDPKAGAARSSLQGKCSQSRPVPASSLECNFLTSFPREAVSSLDRGLWRTWVADAVSSNRPPNQGLDPPSD